MAVDLYVDTDNGNNANNGTSWALAKANLNNAIAVIPTPVTQAYVIHCKGATADTVAPAVLGHSTTAANTITIQVDQADRHYGVWDDTKYHMEFVNKGGIGLNDEFVNVYGVQFRTVSTTDAGHTMDCHPSTSESVQKIAYCIFKGEISADTDMVAIHSGTTGTQYSWNNIVYGYRNGTADLCIAFTAYRPTYLYNNTVYDCRTGVYAPTYTDRAHLVNNLFVSVTNVSMGFNGGLASDSDYNATDSASMGLSVTGGGGSHNKTSISTTNLFIDAAATPRNLHLTANGTADVVRAALSDPGAGLFADDIDGVTRTGAWDKGADQQQGRLYLVLRS